MANSRKKTSTKRKKIPHKATGAIVKQSLKKKVEKAALVPFVNVDLKQIPSLKKKAEKAALVPVPSIKLDLKHIHVVGGNLPRGFLNRWDLSEVPQKLQELQRKIPPGHNMYLFYTTESYYDDSVRVRKDGDLNVPILVVIVAPIPPTTLVARVDMQTQVEVVSDMANLGITWKKSGPGVFVLSSTMPSDERDQLYLLRPTDALNKKPEAVLTVAIKFEGQDVVWECDMPLEECVDDFSEDEDCGDDDERKMNLTEQLLKQKTIDERAAYDAAQRKLKAYTTMLDFFDDRDQAVSDLDSMEVFKIYPSDAKLNPAKQTWLGLSGFQKTKLVNRYIHADEVL